MFFSQPKQKNDQGSTYVELILAIALLSIFSLGVYRYILFTTRTGALLHENITANIAVFQAEKMLKDECSRVVFPYWSPPDPYIYMNDTDVRIPYYNGNKNEQLRCRVEDHILTISTPEHSLPLSFPGCSLEFDDLVENGWTVGIVMTVTREKTGEQIAAIPCPFGGLPTL